MTKFSLYFFLVCVISSLITACNQNKDYKFTQLLVYPENKVLSNIDFVDHDNKPFTQENFEGHWTLFFIGFTSCPDICPTLLTDVSNIYKKLTPEIQKQVKVVFLSVDPKRDTIEHLKRYVTYYHPDFIGMTGKKENIDPFIRSLGAIYTVNNENEEFYMIDHTSRVFVINPEGKRHAIFTSEAMKSMDKSLLVKELEIMVRS
jgi:protein SCO1/2